jgi:HlyD family secretion protein
VKKGAVCARISLRPNMLNVSAAEAQVRRRASACATRRADLERYKKLLATGVISESQFNTYVTNYDLQRAGGPGSAEDHAAAAQDGVRPKNSGNISNLIPPPSTAPCSTCPTRKGSFILESSTFQSGTSVATLADMSDMIFEGLVDESEVGKLKQGMELILNVGALEGKPFKATLEYIAPKGVTDQGTIKFTIRAAVTLDKELFLRRTTAPTRTSCSTSARTCWRSTKAT